MKRLGIIGILVIIIITVSVYFFSSGKEIINDSIQQKTISAKELIVEAKPYIEKYWGDHKYYIGKIIMNLNENIEGEVKIWYKTDMTDKNGVPSIATLDINTKKNKILSVMEQDRNTKIVPGKIDILNWAVDSVDAINIGRKEFEGLKGFGFTKVYLSGQNLFKDGKETWDLTLYNEFNNNAYFLELDVYTGEIYKKRIWD